MLTATSCLLVPEYWWTAACVYAHVKCSTEAMVMEGKVHRSQRRDWPAVTHEAMGMAFHTQAKCVPKRRLGSGVSIHMCAYALYCGLDSGDCLVV